MSTHANNKRFALLTRMSPGVRSRLLSGFEFDKPNLDAMAKAGRSLADEGRYAEAVVVFEFLAFVDGSHGAHHRALGICLERLDRLDDARVAFGDALKADENDAPAWVGLASVKMRQGDRAAALEDLRKARAVTDSSNGALLYRIDAMTRGAGD